MLYNDVLNMICCLIYRYLNFCALKQIKNKSKIGTVGYKKNYKRNNRLIKVIYLSKYQTTDSNTHFHTNMHDSHHKRMLDHNINHTTKNYAKAEKDRFTPCNST